MALPHFVQRGCTEWPFVGVRALCPGFYELPRWSRSSGLLRNRYAPLRARTKVLGCGTIRDKIPVFAVVFGRRRGQMGIKTFVPRFSPIRRFSRGGWTVLTPGKACLKGLAAITTNTTQATIQAQMKPSSSWWRCAEPSRSASRAVGAVFANVQTPRCSRSADGWWPLGVREQV